MSHPYLGVHVFFFPNISIQYNVVDDILVDVRFVTF